MALTLSEWKSCMLELIDGVELELGSTIPAATMLALKAIRERLAGIRTGRMRKLFENDLEELLESKPFLQVATRRFFRKKVPPAVKAALVALEKARDVLAQAKK